MGMKTTKIGPIELNPPVVLAPMAGITNYPFRLLCRRFGAALFVSEMITARALVEGARKAHKLADFGPDESPRSLQLYGVDPQYVGEAVRWLVGEGRVDHIDLNFGCPVRKITRKGGGAAIPAKPRLLRAIVQAAVAGAGPVPVTIKFRMGINDDVLTFIETGRIAEAEGCAAITLHARTAAQLYDGHAHWSAIGELKTAVSTIPVFGNGDIWVARGRPPNDGGNRLRRRRHRAGLPRPSLVVPRARRRLRRPRSEPRSDIRRGCGCHDRARSTADRLVRSREDLDARVPKARRMVHQGIHLERPASRPTHAGENHGRTGRGAQRDRPDEAYPANAHLVRRGKRSGTQKVVLPEGYLDNLDDDTPPEEEDEPISGG